MMYNMIPSRVNRRAREMSLLGENFFDNFLRADNLFEAPSFRVDVREMAEYYELTAELPGMKQEQIEILAHDGVLTISANLSSEHKDEKSGYLYAERRTGTFRRAFDIEGIREDAITARYEDGILTLHLPKVAQEKPQARRIAIQAPGENRETDAENA